MRVTKTRKVVAILFFVLANFRLLSSLNSKYIRCIHCITGERNTNRFHAKQNNFLNRIFEIEFVSQTMGIQNTRLCFHIKRPFGYSIALHSTNSLHRMKFTNVSIPIQTRIQRLWKYYISISANKTIRTSVA